MSRENNLVMGIVLAVFIILAFGGIGMMGFGGYGWMYGMMGGSYSGVWVFGWLLMILMVVALVLFILWLTKQLNEHPQRRGRR